VATEDECRQALHRLADHLRARAANVDLDRRLACRVTDLGVAFHGRLAGGRLLDIEDGDDPDAKIKLTASSDDLVAMLDGRLDVGKAVASRRVSINANPFDLLKLRKLL
jgi:predicted lipid carrier protein YhbT